MDTAGDAYITGQTSSTNFPTTSGAFQTTSGGGNDVFVSKLNPSGTALVYSTYLGHGPLYIYDQTAIAVDSAGDAYVTGSTNSSNFPTTAGAFQPTAPYGGAFVTKLNATGSALIYSTYLHGSSSVPNDTYAMSITVDGAGNGYVTGQTVDTGFPTTPNAFQPSNPGSGSYASGFVTKLNASGSALVYSTFLGGSTGDGASGIAVDSAGSAYVTGSTDSADFPTTAGAFQPSNSSGALGVGGGLAFVTKLNPSGTALVYSTFLGGYSGVGDGGNAIAVDATGSAYVTGSAGDPDFPTTPGALRTTGGQAFVTKLNPSGSALVYSTFLGSASIVGAGIALDGSGDAYVTGSTYAPFPTQNALQGYGGLDDAFVSELNAGGSALLFSTYLGGSNNDSGSGIALDSSGNIYVTGTTSSTNFPTTPGAYQTTYSGGANNAFVAKISVASSPSFAVAGYPSPTTAGVAQTFTVTALNADGTVNTGYTGTVHFTSSDAQAVLPADYTFTAADQGLHTFTATLKTAGSQSVTATDTATGSVTGGETGITVTPAAIANLVFSNVPGGTTAGSAFTLTLTAKDAYGNTATGYTGTVHFTSTDARAVLPADYTFTSADAGSHAFTVTLKTAGTQSVTATDTVTGSLTAAASGIVVHPAAAAKFVLSAPASVTNGVAFSLTLTVEDAYGNVVTGYTGKVHFRSSDGTATLPANYTFTAADAGVHTFTNKAILRKKGKQTITVTDTLNSALTATVTINVV